MESPCSHVNPKSPLVYNSTVSFLTLKGDKHVKYGLKVQAAAEKYTITIVFLVAYIHRCHLGIKNLLVHTSVGN